MPGILLEGIELEGIELAGMPLEGMPPLLPGTEPKADPMAGEEPAPNPEPLLKAPLPPNIMFDCAIASLADTAPRTHNTRAVQACDENRMCIIRSKQGGHAFTIITVQLRHRQGSQARTRS
jgi:hypothetical protein